MIKLLIIDDNEKVARSVSRLFGAPMFSALYRTTLDLNVEHDVVLADWHPFGPAVLELSKKPVVVFTSDPDAVPENVPCVTKPGDTASLVEALTSVVHP